MNVLCFFVLVLSTYIAASPLTAQFADKRGDAFFGMKTNQETIPLGLPMNMKRLRSSLIQIHKNGFFSSKSVISAKELSSILDSIFNNDDLVNTVPHITAFKGSAITLDARNMIYFKDINDLELKMKIGVLINKVYDEDIDPENVLLSVWNQYGCAEGEKDSTQNVFTFHCIVANQGSASYVIFIYDGPDLCGEESANDGRKSLNDKEVYSPMNDPGVIANLLIPNFIESRKDTVEDAPSQQYFYQLQSEDGKCLTLSYDDGAISECTDESGEVASSTVFRITGAPGSQKVEVFGTGKCLDREHCHSSTSNLRYSDCDHCGAIHWDVRSDGTLREDEGKNCVYLVASTQKVLIHHSSDGCTSFNLTSLGDSVLMKSINYGDCLAGGTFEECGSAPRFFVNGLSRHYQFQDTESRDCIDREHCHTDRSNMRLFSCDHCGAIHWSIEGTEIGEDEMKNCVNRDGPALAFVKHCEDSWEKMTFEIVPSNATLKLKTSDELTENYFPTPLVNDYIGAVQSSRIRGIRLLRNDGNGNVVLEIIHSVPSNHVFQISTKVANFRVEFWVARIETYIPFSNNLTPREILARLISSESKIKEFNLRYGAVDSANRIFGKKDGLLSLFVTNDDDDEPAQVPFDVSLLKRIRDALNSHHWWHLPPSLHLQSYKQSYYTFSSKRFYRALYWSTK